MHGPALSGWLLVALCAVTGGYCLLRMRACAGEERRAAGGEAVMGFGMAFMALPAAVLTPPGWSWAVYAAVFGAAALHGLLAVRHGGHHLHHLVGSLAMVYMAVAMATPGAPGAHAGHTATGAGAYPCSRAGSSSITRRTCCARGRGSSRWRRPQAVRRTAPRRRAGRAARRTGRAGRR